MKVIIFIKKILHYIIKRYYISSSPLFINFLRKKGVTIGNGCIFRSPKTTIIDITRPYLITIGNNVDMNVNFKIYTHDWGAHVFINKFGQMVNSSGAVTIGNNIYFGADCTILKGVTIGDNCIIGAGSLVTHSIPANSVAAGNPCKVLCTLEDYYQKRLKKAPSEAVQLINIFYKKMERKPNPNELIEEQIYYTNHQGNLLQKFSSHDDFINWCLNKNNSNTNNNH